MRCTRRNRRTLGFTLVELLVVIGIIAVLISILLPSLAKARNNAMRVKCASQLRQVAMATVIYANENKGLLPPMHLETNSSTFNLINGKDHKIDYMFTQHYNGGTVNADTDPGANIGRLIRRKALAGTDANWLDNPIQRCPAANSEQDRPWRSNYYYNVHPKIVTANGGMVQRWWTRLTSYGKVPTGATKAGRWIGESKDHTFPRMPYALATDPIFDLANATHAQGRSRAWNLAYADGSVRTAVSDSRVARETGKWERFLDMLGYLERVADGQQTKPPGQWDSAGYNLMPIDPPLK